MGNDVRDDDEPVQIAQAKEKDPQAFTALVDRYWTPVYRWLYGLTRSTHTAEDLTQEVFLKAWDKLSLFHAGTNFRGWLFRIARNCFADSYRTHGPKPLELFP